MWKHLKPDGNNLGRSVHIKKHTLSSSCRLFQSVPCYKKTTVFYSMSIIKHLKEIFTEIGVPRCIVSDGGTQFTLQEFQDFMRRWDIQHKITSPTNAHSNGQVEWFVQAIKNSLTKAMEGGEDPHLAILSYIKTPLNHSLSSPAELLNSRKFRCLLPLQIRQQNHIQQYRNVMQHEKHEQAKHYNKSARDLPSLKTGNAVYIQLVPNTGKWIPGIINERVSAQSYKVKTIKSGSMSETENLSESSTQTQGKVYRLQKRAVHLSYSNTHTGRP